MLESIINEEVTTEYGHNVHIGNIRDDLEGKELGENIEIRTKRKQIVHTRDIQRRKGVAAMRAKRV